MTAAAAVEPTELEELMKAQAEAAHEREVGESMLRASTCSMATTMRSRT